jgi:DNA-binding MarR family transcriptional regulator
MNSISKSNRTETIRNLRAVLVATDDIAVPAVNRAMAKLGLSTQNWKLLRFIGARAEITMTDIARWGGHSTAAATGTVDRLEKLGYAERYRAPDDRRKIPVRLTPGGIAIIAQMDEITDAELSDALSESPVTDVMSSSLRKKLGALLTAA